MTWSHNDPRWAPYAAESPTLKRMLEKGYRLTRENWLALNYGPQEPGPHDAWTAEQEAEVPEPLQDHSQVRAAAHRR
jgi:hypothetical protein